LSISSSLEISRRFDIAADICILMVFIATVYMTKDFLSAIPLSIILIYLLKPVYAGIFQLTRHEGLSSFISLMVVFAVILAVLIGLSSVLLIELSNIHSSGVLAVITFIAPIFVLGIAGVIVGPLFYGLLLAIYRAEVYYRERKKFPAPIGLIILNIR